MRIVWQTVRRITNKILGVKGLSKAGILQIRTIETNAQRKPEKIQPSKRFNPKSVCIFSIQLFIYFLKGWQGEFIYQSKASFIGDHFLYSRDLSV